MGATLHFYTSTDMTSLEATDGGTVTVANASQITISDGISTSTYLGQFTYGLTTITGVWQGFQQYESGTLVAEFTGMNADAATAFGYLEANQLQAMLQYILAGNDSIVGSTGNDVLNGYGGADTLIGGTGDDVYYVDNPGDVVTENAGEGNDWVYTTLASYTMPANVEIMTLSGAGPANATGNAGDNIMFGNAWNNYFDGGAGGDFMAGGPGDDAYWVDSASDVVYEKPGEGGDTIVTVINYQLFAGSDVEAIVMLDQGGNINAVGSDFDNLIQGNNFDNVIVGRGGNDRLWGFAGADRFIFNTGDAHDTIFDYNHGQGDYLDIRVSGYTTAAQILAAAHDDGTNTTITFNANDSITLNNVTVAQLSASDFLIIPP
ncbi:MAG TPA: calcium-binding protein [Alphaproteobacteria bacterium]|nr:calcium-binding protein [Alphaproteobacteria bacterium]